MYGDNKLLAFVILLYSEPCDRQTFASDNVFFLSFEYVSDTWNLVLNRIRGSTATIKHELTNCVIVETLLINSYCLYTIVMRTGINQFVFLCAPPTGIFTSFRPLELVQISWY